MTSHANQKYKIFIIGLFLLIVWVANSQMKSINRLTQTDPEMVSSKEEPKQSQRPQPKRGRYPVINPQADFLQPAKMETASNVIASEDTTTNSFPIYDINTDESGVLAQ